MTRVGSWADWYQSVKHFLDKRALPLRIAVEKGRPVAFRGALACSSSPLTASTPSKQAAARQDTSGCFRHLQSNQLRDGTVV